MALIGIDSFQPFPDANGYSATNTELRVWYSRSFIDSDGVSVQGGNGQTGFYITSDVTITLGVPSVASFDLRTTLDAIDPAPQSIQVYARLFSNNAPKAWIFAQDGTPNGWVIPNPDPATTMTYEQLAIYNQTTVLANPPLTFWTAAQIQAYFDSLSPAPNASAITKGITKLSVAPTSAINPIAKGDNDPLVIDAKSYASINTAVAAIGSTPTRLNISTVQTLTGDLTIPATMELNFVQGGQIAGTHTITILGSLTAGQFRIFSSATTVSFTGGTVGEVYVEWWGAVSGASAATTRTAMQAAIDTGKIAYALGPSYTINDTLNFNNATTQVGMLVGAGMGATLISCTHPTNPAILIEYPDSGIPMVVLRDFALRGPATLGVPPPFNSGNFGIYLRGFHTVRNRISDLIIQNVAVNYFGDNAIRLQGPAGPINIINAAIDNIGNYGIELTADTNSEAPQNTSIYGGTIQNGVKGGVAVDGGATTIQAFQMVGMDIELDASQTKPDVYLKNTSGGVIIGGSTSSAVASLSVGDANIYFDTGAVRWNVSGVQNIATGGLSAFGGAYLPNNTIQEATSSPTRKFQIISGGFSAGVDNQDDKIVIALEGNDATYYAMYLLNNHANGISRFALGMTPGGTTGFLYQFDAGTKDTLFFNRATAGTMTFQNSAGAGMSLANDGAGTFDTALKVANTAKFALVPKTDDTWASAMTISVLISNHVIAASNTTSATSTISPSTAGAAGDILKIVTEADASGQVVVTFGGTFHSSGTQTTTASHFSTIQFSSDGTRWVEDYRTTNLA